MYSLLPFWRRNKRAIQFGLSFLALTGLFYLAYYGLRSHTDLSFLKAATAAPVWLILRGFFQNAALENDIVTVDAFRLRIIYECTGVFLMIIFSASVLAYPARWQAKATGLAVGIPIIYVTNVVRLVVLVLVGRSFRPYLETFHVYFWYGTFSLIIVFTWVLWVEIVVDRGEKRTLSR
jgi:archaeosortase B (VPXXXP-CTERM-specific)